MSNMSGWFENETLAALSLGIIFGTIICDLVFEIRPGLAPGDIDAARSYYRGQHTAPLPVNLVLLPLAAILHPGCFGGTCLGGERSAVVVMAGCARGRAGDGGHRRIAEGARTVAQDGRPEARAMPPRSSRCVPASAPRVYPPGDRSGADGPGGAGVALLEQPRGIVARGCHVHGKDGRPTASVTTAFMFRAA